jgi:hypothetical protein
MITQLYVGGTVVPPAFQAHPINYGGSAWCSVETVQGLGAPSPRPEAYDLPRRSGQVNYTKFYGPRAIDVHGRILAGGGTVIGDDAAVIRALDDLKGKIALTDGSALALTFQRPGIPTAEFVLVHPFGELDITYTPREHEILFWAQQFTAPDPRIYGINLKTASYTPLSSGFGLALPLTFPITFSGQDTSTGLVIQNDGNAATPLVFAAFGPADAGFAITNVETQERIVTSGIALAAGQFLLINTGEKTCFLNGVSSRPDAIDAANTVWWSAPPGTTHAKMEGGGFDTTTLLTVEYRDARI